MVRFVIAIFMVAICFEGHTKFKVTVLEEKVTSEVAEKNTSINGSTDEIKMLAEAGKINSLAQVSHDNYKNTPKREYVPVKTMKKLPGIIEEAIIQGVRVWSSIDKTRAVFDLSAPSDYTVSLDKASSKVTVNFKNAIVGNVFKVRKNRDIKSINAVDDHTVEIQLVRNLENKNFLLAPYKKNGYRLVLDFSEGGNNNVVSSDQKHKTTKVASVPVEQNKKQQLNLPTYSQSKNYPTAQKAVNVMVGQHEMLDESKNESSSSNRLIRESSLKAAFGSTSGEKVSQILTNWADRTNHRLEFNLGIWKRVKDLTLTIDVEYGSDFEEAVAGFLTALNGTPQLRGNDVSLHGCFYSNKVLEISVDGCGE